MTFLAPIYSSAWQDFYKPLAMMLLSEGRYSTQISSVPSELTDTLGIVLIPHHAKTSFCICEPHLGDNCFFPAMDISWRITSKAKDVVTMTIHHEISHCESSNGWSAASAPPGCCLSCTPALPSLGLAVMLWCHTSSCVIEVRRIAAKKVLGLEKNLALLLIATHTWVWRPRTCNT